MDFDPSLLPQNPSLVFVHVAPVSRVSGLVILPSESKYQSLSTPDNSNALSRHCCLPLYAFPNLPSASHTQTANQPASSLSLSQAPINPLTMGCVSSTFNQDPSMKFSKQYIRIIKRYLPHFLTDEPSNNDDRLTAFAHWEKVYKENIHTDAHHTSGSGTAIGKLYETFYKYLFEHHPHLKPLFQASIQIQSRVLVHISSGMKSLLSSEDLVQKVMELALVHMKIGVKPEDFDPLGESLIQSMKITSGDDWSEAIEQSWRRIYCHASILILVNIPNTNLDMGDFKDDP